MSVVNLKHMRTAVELTGQGAHTIVLVNGLGLDMHTWGPFAQELAQHHRVVRFDARGVGSAQSSEVSFSTQDMAGDVLELCAQLKIVRPLVLGFSMGGCVAQHIAAMAPDAVAGLVLLSTVARPSQRSSELLTVWRDMAAAGVDRSLILRNQLLWANEERFYEQPGALQTTIDYVLALPQAQDSSGFVRQANACIAHDGRSACSNIRTPSLVLVGAQERVFSVDEVHALSQQIPGARYHCFAHGGHNLWMEYPGEVVSEINRFVAALPRVRLPALWAGDNGACISIIFTTPLFCKPVWACPRPTHLCG